MSENNKNGSNVESNSVEKIKKDSVVTFHYRMCEVLENGDHGDWLEDTFDQEPVAYLYGHNNVISGVENAMSGKVEGDEISITVSPEEGYGLRHDVPVRRVPIKHIYQGKKKYQPGDVVTVETNQGPRDVTVLKAGKFNVDVDLNHPYAGLTLHYEIKIVGVRDARPEELSHGHAHGIGGHQH